MSIFDQRNEVTEDYFARHNPEILNRIYGTTDITPFWVADMDFVVADPIKAELQRLVDRARFPYESNDEGIYQVISDWYRQRHDLLLESSRFLLVPRVLTGIALLIRELTNQGDGVLIQTPVYHQFPKVISNAGRQVVNSPLRNINGRYEMDFDDLDAKLRAANIRAMLLCNPQNPVGRVWSKEELETVVAIANKHNVTVISDEIHSDIIYPGHSFTSLMAIDPVNHVSLIGSPAKTFGMQGVSNGYIYTANTELSDAVYNTLDALYLSHGHTSAMFATIAAYTRGGPWLDELLVYLQNTIDWIGHFLKAELPMITLSPVEGTYQIWFDFSAMELSGDTLKKKYVEAGVGLAPGTWFDEDASGFARMNIAAPRADIENAFKRLKATLEGSVK